MILLICCLLISPADVDSQNISNSVIIDSFNNNEITQTEPEIKCYQVKNENQHKSKKPTQ
ncbi:hypothetical protein C1S83_03585 [Vibrio parahaemolyticus]|nr:hypothetical protein C1S87_03585 [Vibrio parahaemolyticus]PMT89403.1 hypothetical protein C1S83_03585 [Vibrio parahaemolyticus]PMT92663.1 hypothetical protein C1T03_03585 [Vibrio parahaemolyticus]